jgi:AcrR family transcriptional regulator
MSGQRVRRRPDEARNVILDAAEGLLRQGGPAAVQVRAVAKQVGMTDAGVTHHFGSREGLLIALLYRGGTRIRSAVEQATAGWATGGASITELVDSIADVYADGFGELAVALHAAGWRDDGIGMLEPAVDALHAARGSPDVTRAQVRLAVAALHQALATEPVYGHVFRRSAGIREPAASQSRAQRKWWATTLNAVLSGN